ncbi:MAG: ABC transporter ATP-binding protein [Candidatus Heimdallarchaeota archaeon]|nr:ABC transporter ATP-binding protein [Candidatus Heimdallarchaeota archaeon]MCK4876012.1 ABC transporter ATP-binding protein [Candidatus Heimdallarchaeota archaeon]
MSEIRLNHITKIFDEKVTAVRDLSCIINDGEYISLIGPSGCGKTTTLRLIAGTILPTKGRIFFDDVPMERVTIQDRNIGFVFQHFAIFPHLNVWDNVAFGPTIKGKTKKEIEEAVENALKSVGIKERAMVFPSDLSAPELQKTALARVLSSASKILLLDEPLGALDQKVREDFRVFLRSLVKREKLTAIHVTHDQEEALSISDRVALMNRAELIQIGKPEDLIFNPNNIFTSFFVGESDFIQGVVTDDSDKYAKVRVGRSIIKTHNAGIEKGKRVIVAIRREFFSIFGKGQDKNNQLEEQNYVRGTLIEDRFLGLLRRVRIKLENQQIIEAKIHPKFPIKYIENEPVKVLIRPSATRCFEYPKEGIQSVIRM